MNTRFLMTSSAVFLAVLGLCLTFLPKETSLLLQAGDDAFSLLAMQMLGATYLGFAMLNWMAKGMIIGGIYAKPIAVGNFMHFAISAITLLKLNFSITGIQTGLIVITVVMSLFAIWFGIVFRTNPKAVA